MKRFISIPVILVSILCTSSCIQTESVLYTDLCMVNIETSTRLVTDAGLIYNVVESSVSTIPDTLKRVMIICDVLRQSETSQNEYDIHLQNFAHVLTKPAVLKSTVDEEAVGSDGIVPLQLWRGGEYLNATIQFASVINSTTIHKVNLVFDDTRNNPDTLFFSLRHNASGESLEHDDIPQSTLTLSSDYVSFPVTEYIPDGKDEMILHLDWDWYKSEAGYLVKEKEHHNLDITLKK